MFRIKIALFSTLISGSVLIVFGFYFLNVLNSVNIDRIDREILAIGESQLHIRQPKQYWENYEKSLRFIYGPDRWRNLIVRVTDAENQVLYQSPHWPDEIDFESFSGFDFEMEARPERHEQHEQENRALHSGKPPESHFRMDRNMPPPPLRNRHPGPPPAAARLKKPVFQTRKTSSITWRTGIMGNQHVTMQIGMDMAGYYLDAQTFQKAFAVTVPIALLLLAAGGWWIAHRALRPVGLITRTAEGITVRGLDQRIPSAGADTEIKRLINVINSMLDRLEKSFGQAVRFSADAAHELQTPLTILQGVLDDALQHAPSGSDEQRRYGDLLEEVQRLKVIVQKLLILARADAGQLSLHLEPVDISVMVDTLIEDINAIAPHLNIEQQILPGVMVHADKDLLQQVLQNLTSNAMKYNIDKGLIRFQLLVQNQKVFFKISNTGASISVEDQERIFERFFRTDKSRNNTIPGTGLGLSLAREIVHAHNGDLGLYVSEDQLITFTLSLPHFL